ncbi:hypothetical protein JW964_06770 [candidate division KSB1 bacterium]|nr:hypothetical protein [candidate division KSB1 bacterium]
MIKHFFKNQFGNILAFSAIGLGVLFGFAALSVDIGYMLTARNQLQSAVDAAALAGAAQLVNSQSSAINAAIQFAGRNTFVNQTVQLSVADISFPTPTRIQVQTTQPINLFFSRVLGIQTANISAMAVAELGTIVGTGGTKPWAVPDFGWTTGTPVVIKSGVLGAPATNPGYFYPVDFPPLNRGTPETGAQAYEENITYGADSEIFIGDQLQVEPGNMVGPTQQGVNSLIDQDPGAYWDGSSIVNSDFPGYSSPRIVKVPLYDPNLAPESGRNSVTVIGLAAFFIMNISGRDVTGIFLEMTTNGSFGNGYSYLKGVKLTQ